MIKLELVNKKTFYKIVNMKLPDDQKKFVAANVTSLAQAWLEYETTRPYAILKDDEPVGLIMLSWDEEERSVGVWRFMVDFTQQKKGYGREALKQVIEMAKTDENIDFVYLDYVIGNEVAKRLYEKMGFTPTGKIDDGEVVMKMIIKDNPKVAMLTADDDDYEEIEEFIEKNKNLIPSVFLKYKDLTEREELKRVIVYGDTIGLLHKNKLFIGKEYMNYVDEAQKLLKGE